MIALAAVTLTIFGIGLADAQPARPPRSALLPPGSPPGSGGLREFRTALRDLGYIEGQNLVLDVYWEAGRPDRWPALVQEILRRGAVVIVSGRGAATRVVVRATTTVALVAATLDDPVRDGFAQSLARPGRNVTGLTLMSADLGAKRVDLMKQALPDLTRAALMWDVQHSASPPELGVADATARTLGFTLERLGVNGPADLDGAFDRASRARVGAVIMAQGAI